MTNAQTYWIAWHPEYGYRTSLSETKEDLLKSYEAIDMRPVEIRQVRLIESSQVEEWVSVKDRLPEEKTWVLVYDPTDKERPVKDMKFLSHSNGEIWWLTQCWATHWRPLPLPPAPVEVK